MYVSLSMEGKEKGKIHFEYDNFNTVSHNGTQVQKFSFKEIQVAMLSG